MTPAEIIYRRRLAVLEHAARCGNVSAACRVFGISRTRYYEWKRTADAYGLEALMPKSRRTLRLPNATPTHVIEALLTLAVTAPTIGARQYADRRAATGWKIGKTLPSRPLPPFSGTIPLKAPFPRSIGHTTNQPKNAE